MDPCWFVQNFTPDSLKYVVQIGMENLVDFVSSRCVAVFGFNKNYGKRVCCRCQLQKSSRENDPTLIFIIRDCMFIKPFVLETS